MKSFFKSIPHIRKVLRSHASGALLLDFDGTLSVIVPHAGKAQMHKPLREKLLALSKNPRWQVAIVSGRDLKFLMNKVGLKSLIYVGNHGFEIKCPGQKVVVQPSAQRFRPVIAKIHAELKKRTRRLPGVFVEDKTWTGSLHTRMATFADEKRAHEIFKKVTQPFVKMEKIRVSIGKRVLEFRPPLKWNKGEAVKYILKKMKGTPYPVYIGDDTTDEDAFRVLKKKGLGIKVGGKKTLARYGISSPREMPHVLEFFENVSRE